MKRFKVFIVFFILSVTPVSVFAFGDAAILEIQLKEISMTLKTKLMKTISLLKEATVQSKTVLEMRTLAINMKENYDFVKNFDLELYVQDFVDEIESITLLDNLEGKDFDRQFDLVMKEIDRRFTEEEEKSNIKNFARDLKKLWSLQQVKANESAAIARGEQNHANNIATTAANSGLSLIYQAKKEARDLTKEQRTKTTMEFQQYQINDAFKSMKN